jgi:hypothetical protein
MNIFVLDEHSAYAADYHCDQHIHKMILESAQLLSTAFHYHYPKNSLCAYIYKPAYVNHPCAKWTRHSIDNMWWVSHLATSLESIRLDQGSEQHSSMLVIQRIQDYIEPYVHCIPESFEFCGPAVLKLRSNLTIPQKYQSYYRIKQRQWLDEGIRMSYKNRAIPYFLADLSSEILS